MIRHPGVHLIVMLLAVSTLIRAASLDPWKPGMLDIHQISTGRGNSAFFIFPDGTTMLVDAGASADGVPETDPHPNASRRPGEWIARYIQRHAPPNTTTIDYGVITHFHPDHMGQVTAASPLAANGGGYKLTGITDVDAAIPFRKILDRAYPDYMHPVPLTDDNVANYRRFLKYREATGLIAEDFTPGQARQIKLLHEARRYPDFEVRNVIASGWLWLGDGEATRRIFGNVPGDNSEPSENMCSAGFRLRYGKFAYFTGGDLPGEADPGFPSWQAVESLVAPVVGKVDVHVVNQHGSMGEESDIWIKTLESTVSIIPSWAPSHPAPDVLKRMMNSSYPPAKRYVFATDMRPSSRTVIGARADRLSGPPGHIVIRVEPGGGSYRVFVLDNSDENDTVKAVIGPFQSSSL